MINIHAAEPDQLKLRGELTVEIRNAITGRLKSKKTYRNLVVTAAKSSIAAALSGNVGNGKGQIRYCAVGTGTSSPALGNTALQTELYRKQVSIRSSSGNVATFKTFFNQTEANGALKEAGLFGELATDTANSGTLFCRVNINRTKSSNDTLTLTWAVTVG